MEFSKREKIQNGEETKETQQEPSMPGNESPRFDTSSSDSDFEHESTCDICNKTSSSLKPSRQNEKDAQHLKRVCKKEIEKKKVRKLEEDASAGKNLNHGSDFAQIYIRIIKKNFCDRKIMEFSKREKIQNGEETKETQQEPSMPGNESPRFDTSSSDSDFKHEFTCDICNNTFSGPKPSRQNEKDAQHLRRVCKKEIEEKKVRKLEEDDPAGRKKDDPKQTLFVICKTCKRDVWAASELIPKGSDHEKKLAAYTLLKEIQNKGDHIILRKLRQKHKSKSRKVVPVTMGKSSDHFSDPDASESSDENDGACGNPLPLISFDDSSDINKLAKTHEFVEKNMECLDCKMVFNGVYPWFQHLVGEIHEDTLKQKELFDKLRISDASFSKESSSHQCLVQEEDDDVISCRLCNVTLSGQVEARAHLGSKKHIDNLERKNSMTESRGKMKKKSEVNEIAYSKPSVQSSSDVHGHTAHNHSIKAHDLETKGRKIDKQEHERGFSFGHEGFKSISTPTSSPAVEKYGHLGVSYETGGYSPARRTKHEETSAYEELCHSEAISECLQLDFSFTKDATFSSDEYFENDLSLYEYRDIPNFQNIKMDSPEITKNQAKVEDEPLSFKQSYSYCEY